MTERVNIRTILGLAADADRETVQRAFRVRLAELHPDRNAGDQVAAAKFLELLAAYAREFTTTNG